MKEKGVAAYQHLPNVQKDTDNLKKGVAAYRYLQNIRKDIRKDNLKKGVAAYRYLRNVQKNRAEIREKGPLPA